MSTTLGGLNSQCHFPTLYLDQTFNFPGIILGLFLVCSYTEIRALWDLVLKGGEISVRPSTLDRP